jgi:hypothetical protein
MIAPFMTLYQHTCLAKTARKERYTRRHTSHSASSQHAAQARLLRRGDAEPVVALDADPRAGIGAVEASQGRFPRVRAAVALGAVDAGRDGPQLGPVDVVGELLAAAGGPRGGARHPGVLERDHVVDVQVRGRGEGGAVVRGAPAARGGRAGAVDHDAGAVAPEDVLARVARARDGNPGREQVAVVGALVGPGAHRQTGQLAGGRAGAGDAGLEKNVSGTDSQSGLVSR